MEKRIMTAVEKLVFVGEQAGFSVEQMIQILQTGASVESLLDMIERRVCSLSRQASSRRVV